MKRLSILSFSALLGLVSLFTTPATALAVPPANHLVISEIKTDGPLGYNEFIELYNPTNTAISNSTFRLYIHNQVGAENQKEISLVPGRPTSIAPGGFYLIALESGAYAAQADATYNAIGTTLSDDNSVSIRTGAANTIVDLVGWGSATGSSRSEGSPFAPNPAASESIERKPGATSSRGNAIDTNNNANDFQLRSLPEPQSTSSALEPTLAAAAATGLTGSDQSGDHGGNIVLNWTKSADDGAGFNNVTGYDVWRRLSTDASYPASPIGSVAAGQTQFIDSNATTGQAYVYRVETKDGVYTALSAESSAVASSDNLGPIVNVNSPVNSSFVNSSSPTISGKITDPSGVTSATASIDGGSPVTLTLDGSGNFNQVMSGLSQGAHTLAVRATDPTGNVSQVNVNFTVDSVSPIVSLSLPASTDRFTVKATLTATDAIAGLSEMQFSFDGVFDTEAWEPFSAEKILSLPHVEGGRTVWVKVRDRAGNVSSIASAATLVEVTFVTAPTNAYSSTVGNAITITWDHVAAAASYLVRYTDGQTLYGPISTTGNSVKIENLDLSKTYRFEVAAVSRSGAVSSYTKVFPSAAEAAAAAGASTTSTTSSGTSGNTGQPATVVSTSTAGTQSSRPTGGPDEDPTLIALETGTAEPNATTETATVSPVAPVAPTVTASPSPSPADEKPADEASQEGEVKAIEDEQSTDWTRILVALSILIIAAGIATGGWYLYQWWLARGKKDGKSGRW